MITSIDTEDNLINPIPIFEKTTTNKELPKLIKEVYVKHTTKTIINAEKLNTFPLRWGKIYLLLQLLCDNLLGGQAKIIR